jgi:hypothetical protein
LDEIVAIQKKKNSGLKHLGRNETYRRIHEGCFNCKYALFVIKIILWEQTGTFLRLIFCLSLAIEKSTKTLSNIKSQMIKTKISIIILSEYCKYWTEIIKDHRNNSIEQMRASDLNCTAWYNSALRVWPWWPDPWLANNCTVRTIMDFTYSLLKIK